MKTFSQVLLFHLLKALDDLEIVCVIVDVIRHQLLVDSLAREASVTKAVGGGENPELVDESSPALVGVETLWRT